MARKRAKVREPNGILDTIEVGQGTLGWKSAYGRRFKRVPWHMLADKLEQS